MSKRVVPVCDGCLDYGPDVQFTTVTIGERRYDNCPSCVSAVENFAGRGILPHEPAVIPQRPELPQEEISLPPALSNVTPLSPLLGPR